MNIKYTILALHLLQSLVGNTHGIGLPTTEQNIDDLLDKQGIEPCNKSTTFLNQSLHKSEVKERQNIFPGNTTQMIADETPSLGPCPTAAALSTSTSNNSIAAGLSTSNPIAAGLPTSNPIAAGLSTSTAIVAHENVNISELRTIFQCVDYALCSYNKQFKVPVCYCDSLCVLYDDCCIDYRISNSSSYKVSPGETVKNSQSTSAESARYTEIQTFQPFYSCSVWCYGGHYVGYQFVSSCPAGTNADLVDLCANNDIDVPMTMIPVWGANGIHFRNKFCAECHNTSIIKYWELIIDEVHDPSPKLTKEKLFSVLVQFNCRSVVVPPTNADTRHCKRTVNTLRYGEPNTSFHYNNKTYLGSDLCRIFRFPIHETLPRVRMSEETISLNRIEVYRNSACAHTGLYMFNSCIKGSDLTILDILYRHAYDQYSLSLLFQFDHLLPQQDKMVCEKHKHMLTFLVSII